MSNKLATNKNEFKLKGRLAQKGYDLWRHTFTGTNKETGEEKQFFIEFFACNPFYSQHIPVLGQHILNKKNGILPSYLMVKAGWWGENATQIHKFYAWKNTTISTDSDFSINTGDCFCSDKKLSGEIKLSKNDSNINPQYMCDYGNISWDLILNKQAPKYKDNFLYKAFDKFNSFDTQWYLSGLKTLYTGSIFVNDEKYIVDPYSCNGYSDKNWGRHFPNPWIWLTSNNLTSKSTGKALKNSAFSVLGASPTVCGIPAKNKIFSNIIYEKKNHEFNYLKTLCHSKSNFIVSENENEMFWTIKQKNSKFILEAKIRCLKKDMLKLNYESPDGLKLHNNLWSGGNGCGIIYLWKKKLFEKELIDKIIANNVRCQYGICDKI